MSITRIENLMKVGTVEETGSIQHANVLLGEGYFLLDIYTHDSKPVFVLAKNR